MRERKNIKLRVDMNEDTKFKIIDRKPERDLIYCIWIKLLLLAGKVNKEGELHLSSSIPYTVETLAIELNRDAEQVKLALDVFLELEMIEVTKHNVYKVKNFAKHQNIKVKEQSSALNDIKEENKVVNNEVTIENDIEAESTTVGKDINDEEKVLKDEELIFNVSDIKIDTNQGERDKCNSDKIVQTKESKFNEEIVILDIENLIGEEIGNVKENETEQVENNKKLDDNLSDSKINKTQINDTINVDKNILPVDKRKKRNSKKKNQIFKDGFQDVKEKYVSETWEGIGCFKEQEGDEVIMEWKFS
ncbi:MAG: hypothetical protein E7208_11425 [Clostridium butyricum]|nr:hypothetical protein [Clostridium butyricum]